MPRRRGNAPEHTRARRGAQEAAVRGLVGDAVTEAHEAHAAAQHDPASSARSFLSEAALAAVRALNGAGGPTLLMAMHRIVNAGRPGLRIPGAALYGHLMEWRTSHRSGRPLSIGDTLQLTGPGSATSLHAGPRPAARSEDALPRGRGPLPEPGTGHLPERRGRTGCGTPPSTSTRRGVGMKVLPWVVVGAGGLGAGKTSGAGTRGVSLDVVIGGRTGYSDTNRGESSDNRSKVHADCYPAENPSL